MMYCITLSIVLLALVVGTIACVHKDNVMQRPMIELVDEDMTELLTLPVIIHMPTKQWIKDFDMIFADANRFYVPHGIYLHLVDIVIEDYDHEIDIASNDHNVLFQKLDEDYPHNGTMHVYFASELNDSEALENYGGYHYRPRGRHPRGLITMIHYYAPEYLAFVLAHEIGHALSLQHVMNEENVMHREALHDIKSFTDAQGARLRRHVEIFRRKRSKS